MNTRTWAHAIVRRYPQAWRERYEAEVRGLIDDTPVQFRDLGELIRGFFTERARELLMSDENPRRTATILGLATPIAGATFIGLAWLTSVGLLKLTAPWPDLAQYAAGGVFCILCGTVATLMIRSKRQDPNRPFSVPPDVAVRALPLTFVAVTLYAAVIAAAESSPPSAIPSWISQISNWFWCALFAGSQIASFFPGHELLQVFGRVSFAEGQIRSNEQWVAGCRDMISKGVPSPLQDALTQVGKWTLERDSARTRLKELGYRARFRGPVYYADDRGITT